MLFMLLARSTLKTPRVLNTLGTPQGVAGSLSGPSRRKKGPVRIMVMCMTCSSPCSSHPHAHLHAQLGLISASAAPSAVIVIGARARMHSSGRRAAAATVSDGEIS